MESSSDVIIRKETAEDYYETECCVREAFWNLYKEGADEHCLVYRLRSDPIYLPEISRIATTKEGKIIGAIFYSKTEVVTNEGKVGVITFAPLCVHPDYQKKGVGRKLLVETMNLAKKTGYKAIIIMGVPEYYPKFGFKTCDNYNITTEEGKNFDAFMCYELQPNALANVKGYFRLGEVFNDRTQQEIDDFDKNYPPKVKEKTSTQLKTSH